jgi:hypothetical protein
MRSAEKYNEYPVRFDFTELYQSDLMSMHREVMNYRHSKTAKNDGEDC